MQLGLTLAADISEQWDFSNASDYMIDNSSEISNGVVSLKAQEYISDTNTMALYSMNEEAGISVSDSSSNANNLTTVRSPSFIDGLFSNGLSLNGNNQYASASDSASLSITGQQNLET